MHNKIRFFILPFALLFFAGCDRMRVNSSRISLEIPQTVSKKLSASSTATLMLEHLVVQVTGPDLKEPFLVIHNSESNKNIVPSEVVFDIPSGSDRVIQVIAAYSRGEEEDTTIYYGDVVKSLSGASEVVDVPVTKLGGATTLVANVAGRFLTAPNSGPTGELVVTYSPPGKPKIPVIKERMTSGWFETVIFDNIALDYTLSDGTIIGKDWTTLALSPNPARLHIYSPPSYRRYRNYVSDSDIWSPKTAELKIMGFYSIVPEFTANKKVCATSQFENGGDIFSHGMYSLLNQYSPLVYKHNPLATTTEKDGGYISLSGGRPLADCSPIETYINNLYFNNSQATFNQSYIDYDGTLNVRGLLKRIATRTPVSMREYYEIYSSPATGPFMQIHPINGVSSALTSYQIWRMPTPQIGNQNNNEDCNVNRLKEAGGVLLSTKPLTKMADGKVMITKYELHEVASNPINHVVCLAQENTVVGSQINPYDLFDSKLATHVRIDSFYENYYLSLTKGQCTAIEISLSSMLNAVAPHHNATSVAVHLSSHSSGTPVSVLYDNNNCAGTPSSSVNLDFLQGETKKKMYFFVNTASGSELTLSTTNNHDLTDLPTTLNLETPNSSSASNIALLINGSPLHNKISLFANGCTPIDIIYLNNQALATVSGNSIIHWWEQNGTTYGVPETYVNNCHDKIPLSSSLPVVNGRASFGIVTGSNLVNDQILGFTGFGHEAKIAINPTPVAYKITAQVPATHTEPMTFGKCHPLDITARDRQGQLVTMEPGKTLPFVISSSLSFLTTYYADFSCTTPLSNYEVQPGQSTKTVYIKTNFTGSVQYMLNSAYTEFEHYQVESVVYNYLPNPILVNGPSVITAGLNQAYQIGGGVPSYSVMVMGSPVGVSASIDNTNSNSPLLIVNSSITGTFEIHVMDSAGQMLPLIVTVN